MNKLNIFYQEPDPDRWLPFDRYPRKVIRRVVRGKHRPGGQEMVAINLLKGLDKLGVPYRYNDFSFIKKHPEELACIVGKTNVLYDWKGSNPILFGASVFSHPFEDVHLFDKYTNLKKILVPGPWMKDMFDPFYPGKVISWPVGIDTDEWSDTLKKQPEVDFLIYDKIRWDYEKVDHELLQPVKQILTSNGYSIETIKYSFYSPDELKAKLSRCKACIFLCEHETQGLAYQQILSSNTPILAWDREGFWLDPSFYPDKVQYSPVSAVPYWDERCGEKFECVQQFEERLPVFMDRVKQGFYNPRQYILDNLTLEKCALKYLEICKALS